MDAPSNRGFNTTSANREIKDGMFRLLFDTQENAAELYYALTGIKCRPNEVQIITIMTVISGKLKNDLAFIVRGKMMVVGEHMSSHAEPTHPLLMYVGALYEKWIKMKGEEKLLYGSKQYKIPTPEFVVFYNGTAARPEKEVLYLSSAFELPGDKELGSLELEVPVYNINKGMNKELFDRSPKLKQNAEFIAKVRELNKLYNDYVRVVQEATNYCIANGILADFLKEQGGKVVSILTAEYNLETHMRVYGEELLENRNIELAKEMLVMVSLLIKLLSGLSFQRKP